MSSSSTIRAYVDWRKSAVFAGEDIECIITFTNTTPVPAHRSHDALALQTPERSSNGQGSHGANTVAALQKAQLPKISGQSPRAQNSRKANHRQNRSLNLTKSTTNGSSPKQEMDMTMRKDKGGHNREQFLSVTSLGIASEKGVGTEVTDHIPDPHRNHGRSASLQIVSWGSGGMLSSPSYINILSGK